MDEDDLIGLLPTNYAVAVRLRRAGLPDSIIAVAAAVDEAAVAPLVLLAEAKLQTLERSTLDRVVVPVDPPDRDGPPVGAPNRVEVLP